LTSLLRPFQQGLLSVPTVLGMLIATAGFVALTAIWLPPGASLARRVKKGAALILVLAATVIAGVAQANTVLDVTADRRNSFQPGDQTLLRQLLEPLLVTVHLA
jgi:ABC-2 type transport system permease protein